MPTKTERATEPSQHEQLLDEWEILGEAFRDQSRRMRQSPAPLKLEQIKTQKKNKKKET